MLLHLIGAMACCFGFVVGLFLMFGAPLMVIAEERWNKFAKVVGNLITICVCEGLGRLCFMVFDWGTRHIK